MEFLLKSYFNGLCNLVRKQKDTRITADFVFFISFPIRKNNATFHTCVFHLWGLLIQTCWGQNLTLSRLIAKG